MSGLLIDSKGVKLSPLPDFFIGAHAALDESRVANS